MRFTLTKRRVVDKPKAFGASSPQLREQKIDLEQLKGLDMTSMPEKFVIFDLETTGLDPHEDRIIEMGAIKVDKQKLFETLEPMSWQCFVKQN